MERYARQTVFGRIGKEGQQKLLDSKVAVIGMGALGTVAANNLCRAGVGHIRMADRDYVEHTNLQRQMLYNEEDAEQSLPKVIAAFNHLSKINSEITLEPIIADVNSSNVEDIIDGVDLVLDASDNFEVRCLINEACDKHEIPWIYCGALGSEGTTLNIIPKSQGPCLRCLLGDSVSAAGQSCSTFGVLNMITSVMAGIQSAEALKILLNSKFVRKELLTVDLWGNSFYSAELKRDNDCPVCVHKRYENLQKVSGSYTVELCGSDSVQVVLPHVKKIDFEELAGRLKSVGSVQFSQYMLKFSDDRYEIMLFSDGRAIIKNAIDANSAKSVYAEYIGL